MGDLPLGERCKTYTGMPPIGSPERARYHSDPDYAALYWQASGNLATLPARNAKARLEREAAQEQRDLMQRAERAAKAQLREHIAEAKAEIKWLSRREGAAARLRKVTEWLDHMQQQLRGS